MSSPETGRLARRTDALTEDLRAVSDTVDVIRVTVDEHTQALGRLERTVDEHTTVLGRLERTVDQHTVVFEQHGEMLVEILRRLEPAAG